MKHKTEKKQKKVKTLNPQMYVLLGNVFKKCYQEKAKLVTQSLLSLLRRQKKSSSETKKKDEKTLGKDLFLYKGNFIPCLCTLFFPLISSVGCCVHCGNAYSAVRTICRL